MEEVIEPAHIKELLALVKTISRHPGVYVMKDLDGQIVYIGKAKNLRARVKTYFMGGDGRAQIQFLMNRVRSFETIVTGSEEQAFILERDLIAKHKPRYNIRLKDDKAYLSIRIDESKQWPRLELVRRVEQDGARYYGPYTFTYEVRELLDIINRTIPLRTCSDTVLFNRQRPCLEYQIKRCAAPCCLSVSTEAYAEWILQARQVLEGKTGKLVQDLREKMQKASLDLRFEEAARLRDSLKILENFGAGQEYVSSGTEHRDVFAIYREERLAVLSVLNVRYGRIADNKNYLLRNVEVSDEEVISSAVLDYYQDSREVPEEVILACAPPEEDFIVRFLKDRAGRKVELTVPERGLKTRLLGLARLNAEQHFKASFDAESRYLEVSKALARTARLRQVPRKIECVDISNFQGSDIVGALVAYTDGAPTKSSYKRYKISAQGKPDDFASIYEVVQRRLRRGMEADDLPDLLIIDGGKGQLQAALRARDEVNCNLEIIALAKERTQRDFRAVQINKSNERIFIEGQEEPVLLEPDAALTHFIARVRDEVHRFVITFHRARRSKRVFSSVLDEIAGVGPERRRRLLKEFGSVAAIKKAELAEIARAGRMPKTLAAKILKVLNES